MMKKLDADTKTLQKDLLKVLEADKKKNEDALRNNQLSDDEKAFAVTKVKIDSETIERIEKLLQLGQIEELGQVNGNVILF